MSNKKKLWQIFGPVLVALGLVGLVFFLPFKAAHYSQQDLREASVSFSRNIIKGESVKNAAFSDKHTNYVPFFGSSELSRFDAMHPSVLAEKYNRSYRPFMLGRAGSDALVQYMGMQEMPQALNQKKAVFVISPQWFTKDGAGAFDLFYSPLQTVDWLRQMDQPSATDRFVARTLLKQAQIKNSPYYHRLVQKVADGKELSGADQSSLKIRHAYLARQDQLFSNFEMTQNYQNKVVPDGKPLPDRYQKQQLNQLAEEQGEKGSNSNRFHIKNSFYRTRVKGQVKDLKGVQKDYDYRQSPEYGYFQAVLENFAKQGTQVEFVITPVNKRWTDYTGLNMNMYQESVAKIKHQLQSQGFNNIADLSRNGGEDYYMQDTIHIGWRGWLDLDQHLNPFLSSPYQKPTYHINDRFLSKEWENLKPEDQDVNAFS
ncbi:D-alanyl-lipoteichoic acid biosynthesis protein DltD [Leuconostocaceae bacterium ESL0958]|nr:D-alanyl-lipoteichoic acid biosynthesis protein DltD [Leuconostocaceae bacterium ESL0958]